MAKEISQTQSSSIASQHPLYQVMQPTWNLIDTLMGGTSAMRAASETYLPKEDEEETTDYSNRLSRSFLYNGLRDAIRTLKSKPFRQLVTVNDDADWIKTIEKDMDGKGNTLTAGTRAIFEKALSHGMIHTVVDIVEGREAPVIKAIAAPQLFNWQYEVTEGECVLTHIRYTEVMFTPNKDDPNVMETRYIIKAITANGVDSKDKKVMGSIQTWEQKVIGESWTLIDTQGYDFDKIYLKTGYFTDVGFMVAEPPMEDLAYANLNHWQNSSDHNNVLRFVRTGIIYGTGVPEKQQNGIIAGVNNIAWFEDPNAKLQRLDYGNVPVDASRQNLQDLEMQMEHLGMMPMVQRTVEATATEKTIDNDNSMSLLHQWVRATSELMTETFKMAADLAGLPIKEDFDVHIYDEFSAISSVEMGNLLANYYNSKIISHKTVVDEAKKKGVLSDTIDAEEEKIAIDDESVASVENFIPPTEPAEGENE